MVPSNTLETPKADTARVDPNGPTTVLVVDDAPVDRLVTGALIEQMPGWRAQYAEGGEDALATIARERPRIVLTDLNMPKMDGLALVAEVHRQYPAVPVVLMTAFGNEEIALQALREGAASYVPKKSLERDLASTLEQVAAAAQVEHRHQRLLERLAQAELQFVLDNDRFLIASLVAHLRNYLVRLGLCNETAMTRVCIALEEALLNAIFHGNLELSSDLRQDGEEAYYRLVEERRGIAPFRDRQVFCTARLSRAEVSVTIRDEGRGFDPSTLPDPTDPANLGRVGGRGLLLIRTFMDSVTHNQAGNEITLVKRGKHPDKVTR
jgi:CheY-like chemotaxis protein/anti-sigma regulatory factor (Ser/Thr protein kinase)